MNKNKDYLKWIVVLLILIIVFVMLHSFMLRVLIRWGGAFISFAAVACIFYALLGIFPSLNKKKPIKYLLTICMIVICIFIYYEFNKPKVVYMQEDVIYVLPKSDTSKEK